MCQNLNCLHSTQLLGSNYHSHQLLTEVLHFDSLRLEAKRYTYNLSQDLSYLSALPVVHLHTHCITQTLCQVT